jgi:hypothetical protein
MATALAIIIFAGFTYLLFAELIAMAASLMPSTADSTAYNTANSVGESGAASANHFAVGGTLIMGFMMLSILLNGARYILMKNTHLVATHDNNLQ